MQEILSKLRSGVISQAEAEEQINALSQPKPKMKRDRPKKAKSPPKKNGRPRLLSTYERNIEIMKDRVILDVLNVSWTGEEKRKFLSERYCVSEKQIEACITELNKRAKNGEVEFCQITHVVRFMSEQHKMSVFFDEVLERKPTVHLRHIVQGSYVISSPKQPSIK
ncbi:MAG: hypothetical protein QX199_13230 [Methylococcaceae bacterium]